MMSVALLSPFVLEGCCGSRGTGLQQRALSPPLGPSLPGVGDSMLPRSVCLPKAQVWVPPLPCGLALFAACEAADTGAKLTEWWWSTRHVRTQGIWIRVPSRPMVPGRSCPPPSSNPSPGPPLHIVLL